MHPQDRSEGGIHLPSPSAMVPFILPDDQKAALRDDCMSALFGVLDDLAVSPEKLRDPLATAREGEVFRRLLEALDQGKIAVPDEAMKARFERLSESYDRMAEYGEITTTHDAHRALLRVLGGSEEEEGEEGEEVLRSLGPGWDPDDDADCRREVLALLLDEAPHCMSFPDVAVFLAGDPENLGETNALRDAIRVLSMAGLVRREGGALAPTRPARQMADLGFTIG
jgi:hypothetical protein